METIVIANSENPVLDEPFLLAKGVPVLEGRGEPALAATPLALALPAVGIGMLPPLETLTSLAAAEAVAGVPVAARAALQICSCEYRSGIYIFHRLRLTLREAMIAGLHTLVKPGEITVSEVIDDDNYLTSNGVLSSSNVPVSATLETCRDRWKNSRVAVTRNSLRRRIHTGDSVLDTCRECLLEWRALCGALSTPLPRALFCSVFHELTRLDIGGAACLRIA